MKQYLWCENVSKHVCQLCAAARRADWQLPCLQALMLSNFKEWPSAAITVEFWMWSVDTCRWGSPISYAAGSYESADNTFLIFNYNDWCSSCLAALLHLVPAAAAC